MVLQKIGFFACLKEHAISFPTITEEPLPAAKAIKSNWYVGFCQQKNICILVLQNALYMGEVAIKNCFSVFLNILPCDLHTCPYVRTIFLSVFSIPLKTRVMGADPFPKKRLTISIRLLLIFGLMRMVSPFFTYYDLIYAFLIIVLAYLKHLRALIDALIFVGFLAHYVRSKEQKNLFRGKNTM